MMALPYVFFLFFFFDSNLYRIMSSSCFTWKHKTFAPSSNRHDLGLNCGTNGLKQNRIHE